MTELRAEFTALKTTMGSADPVRLRYIESMLCKAERAQGQLALLLEVKLRDAMADYRDKLAAKPAVATRTGKQKQADKGLSGLLRLLNEYQAEDHDPNLAPLERKLRQQEMEVVDEIADQANPSGDNTQVRQEELKAARRFQSAMVKLNADKVVTQAIAEIPDDCGPLNPQRLATRSLETMRDLSPHYLSRFVSYIDTLFWLENADKGRRK